jgi:hypothetical protein
MSVDIKKVPIFERYSITELTGILPMYKVRYLEDLRDGRKPITNKFRQTACAVLQRTKAELFGEGV